MDGYTTTMTIFIFFFLLFWWFMLIFYKVNAPVKIYNRFQYKFIDDLTNCEFCQESHIGTFFAVLLFLYCGEYFVLTFGFMSAALSNLLKK